MQVRPCVQPHRVLVGLDHRGRPRCPRCRRASGEAAGGDLLDPHCLTPIACRRSMGRSLRAAGGPVVRVRDTRCVAFATQRTAGLRGVGEGVLDWEGGRTRYRVEGDLGARPAPLPALRGRPGGTHGYLEPLAVLAERAGRPCVLYDQIGCGRSRHSATRPRAAGPSGSPAFASVSNGDTTGLASGPIASDAAIAAAARCATLTTRWVTVRPNPTRRPRRRNERGRSHPTRPPVRLHDRCCASP